MKIPPYDPRYTLDNRMDVRHPGRWWSLHEYQRVVTLHDGSSYDITVPKDFDHDAASVPKLFRNIVDKWGRHSTAALLHDYIYDRRSLDRRTADYIFLTVMKEDGVPWLRRTAMFVVVRLFGGSTYDT